MSLGCIFWLRSPRLKCVATLHKPLRCYDSVCVFNSLYLSSYSRYQSSRSMSHTSPCQFHSYIELHRAISWTTFGQIRFFAMSNAFTIFFLSLHLWRATSRTGQWYTQTHGYSSSSAIQLCVVTTWMDFVACSFSHSIRGVNANVRNEQQKRRISQCSIFFRIHSNARCTNGNNAYSVTVIATRNDAMASKCGKRNAKWKSACRLSRTIYLAKWNEY